MSENAVTTNDKMPLYAFNKLFKSYSRITQLKYLQKYLSFSEFPMPQMLAIQDIVLLNFSLQTSIKQRWLCTMSPK